MIGLLISHYQTNNKLKIMKRIFLIFVLVLITSQGWTQETNRNQFSNTPESARYQIVQSELVAKITFKIDKYTGETFQLVKGENGLTWQAIETQRHTQDETNINKVNYQIFTSGLAVRMTFLLNVNTGVTWQLSEDSDDNLFWIALE